MDETDRLIMAGIFGALWFGALAVNAFYVYCQVCNPTLDGPSTLPVFGSLFGVFALLVAPVAMWYVRLLWLPLALLPDLGPIVVYRLIAWRRRPGTPSGNRALCAVALKAVSGRIPPEVFAEADQLINRHSEWGVGIEYLIDYLCEEDVGITRYQYRALQEAMQAMGHGAPDRLATLKMQVRADRRGTN